MQYDARQVEKANRLKAKTDLKAAIKSAVDAGYFYEDVCSILADTLNEISKEKKKNG
jgi:hypothetical protein